MVLKQNLAGIAIIQDLGYLYDEEGNLERYNIFEARMLVRCDADGKLYLYDLVRTKKETSKPHEQ